MGSVKNKRIVPLSLFYLKYLAVLFVCVLTAAAVSAIAAVVLVIKLGDVIYPADYAEKMAKAASSEIEDAEEVNEALIPELCTYIIFGTSGEVKSGNIRDAAVKDAWRAVQENLPGIRGYYYTVIERDGEFVVLRYKIVPQYKSPVLRKYLPAPQNMMSVIILCLMMLIVVIIAICFGRALNKKLSPLISAAEKIRNQELEFSIPPSDIKEIDAVINAVEDMRAALKESLESQWKSEQLKKEQTLALAHDLKTPLTLIRGNAELLYDTKLTSEQKEYINYIQSSSLQMQNYVQALIEITRDGYRLRLQKTDISHFLKEAAGQAKGLCLVKGIQLQESFEYRAQCFLADRDLLMRALINVFSNAVENTPTGGTIFFKVFEEESSIVFAVSDTGSGFSDEALKHAAEQFYMGDSSRSSQFHYGIGLFMADIVTKQHGGQLSLVNSQETGGASVAIKIPYAACGKS